MEGCWLSRDGIEEKGGMNLYGFVGNNPANFIDLLGQDFIAIGRTPVVNEAIANHMVIMYFEDSECYPAEGTRIVDSGISRSILQRARQDGRFELIPSHIRYWQHLVGWSGRVSISFIYDDVRNYPLSLCWVFSSNKLSIFDGYKEKRRKFRDQYGRST